MENQTRESIDPVFSISLKSKTKITDIGLRVVVTSFLIDDGRFEKGKVINISENEVNILVEGDRGDVNDMSNNLRNKLEKSGRDEGLMIPSHIEIGEPQQLGSNPHTVNLPYLTDFAQSLMLEQTGKGVCVMSRGFSSMSKGFSSMSKGFSSLNSDLNTGFSSMGERFDKMVDLLKQYLSKS